MALMSAENPTEGKRSLRFKMAPNTILLDGIGYE